MVTLTGLLLLESIELIRYQPTNKKSVQNTKTNTIQ